jgi:hypothetical protein
MNPPAELQNLTPLRSVDLPLNLHDILSSFLNGTSGLMETLRNFWLLLPDYLVSLMMKIFSFSFILSIILIIFVIWTANNLMRIRREMHDALALPGQGKEEESDKVLPTKKNEKWEKVIVHINSQNPNDWKLAILECDIMLSDILEKMGYMQQSIGDKLKSIEPSDFVNIEAAWEAHKIRNQIAHEGSDFALNEREAKRVIGLYELVFREFEYI